MWHLNWSPEVSSQSGKLGVPGPDVPHTPLDFHLRLAIFLLFAQVQRT